MKQDDGGPAFPKFREPTNNGFSYQDGMSLRDFFAAHALAGMEMWAPNDLDKPIGTPMSHARMQELRAQFAYAQADAMLKERDK